MRQILTIIFTIFTCVIAFSAMAQVNLVLNPSFEVDTKIPSDWNEIQYAKYWSPIDSNGNPDTSGTEPICTPELISLYDTVGMRYASAPQDAFFYHYPRTGNAMCQMTMYGNGAQYHHRDYTQGRLSVPLSESISYCVTFYVAFEQGTGYAVNNIGAYIDAGYIDTGMYDTCCLATLGVVDTYCTQPKSMYTPQILETSVILDTLGRATNDSALYERRWVKIQGSFVATGGEKYITIGLFSEDSNTTIISLPPPPEYFYTSCAWGPGGWPHFPNGMYLIDDVSMVRSDARASAGLDVSIGRGSSVWIGNDTAAVGGGDGMPCWWYVLDTTTGVLSAAIDSGGRIKVSPDSTTTYVEMMNLCGNITYDTVVVSVWPLGMEQVISDNLFIYPNPVKNMLYINNAPLHTKFSIINLIGQEIQTDVIMDKSIDVSNLQTGIYFIELTDEYGNRKTMNFIKM